MSFCELYTFIAYIFVQTKKKGEHIEEEISIPVSTFNHSYKKLLLLLKIPSPLATHHRACDVAGTNSKESAMQTFQVDVGREKEDQTERPWREEAH